MLRPAISDFPIALPVDQSESNDVGSTAVNLPVLPAAARAL